MSYFRPPHRLFLFTELLRSLINAILFIKTVLIRTISEQKIEQGNSIKPYSLSILHLILYPLFFQVSQNYLDHYIYTIKSAHLFYTENAPSVTALREICYKAGGERCFHLIFSESAWHIS